ncbi:unnamed protein product [Urochloa decumbens]|uniref:Glycosyltransferase n=1 Tax=Urochloa decumbens TaxID=240449 RepID=A0ABC9B4A0_9POAL
MDAAAAAAAAPFPAAADRALPVARVRPPPPLPGARRAAGGHRVSFVSTPRNGGGTAVDLVALPLPRVDGLPDGAESTNDIPTGDKLDPPLRRLRRPRRALRRLPRRSGAAGAQGAVRDADADRGAESMTLERCTVAAIRSCLEWELDAFPLAAALLGRPLIPLGLLPPPPPSDGGGRAADMHRDDDDAAVRWLDAQPAKSVVYIALGSEVPLPVELVHKMALGLELAGTRFLWALRKPRGVADTDLLPSGFEERTRGHGLVTMGWVPQMNILAHGAVGAFLTHCGRSSLIEGLLYGHPLIMLPIATDQGPNARLMEGRKVGLQVPRDEDDGSFDRHGVASVVWAVMVEEDTRRVFVANAMKMQEIVADRELHERYLDEFVEQLRSYIMNDNSPSLTKT